MSTLKMKNLNQVPNSFWFSPWAHFLLVHHYPTLRSLTPARVKAWSNHKKCTKKSIQICLPNLCPKQIYEHMRHIPKKKYTLVIKLCSTSKLDWKFQSNRWKKCVTVFSPMMQHSNPWPTGRQFVTFPSWARSRSRPAMALSFGSAKILTPRLLWCVEP